MRSFYLKALFVAASLLVATPTRAADAAPAPGRPRIVTISIVGTNDLHGHVEALPRLGGYIANLRQARERTGGGVVLLDAGDMFQGTLEANLTEGAAVVAAYNALKYDAAAIGNHDFDYGPVGPAPTPRATADDPRGALKARAAEAHFPFLAANLVDAATGKLPDWPNVHASAMVHVGGVDVGVIGLANAGTASMTAPANFAGLRALPLEPAVVAAARELRRQGANAILVVAHAGGSCTAFTHGDDLSSCQRDSEIFQLARALPPGTVDAIVAGHVHRAIAHRVAGIPIVESYANGRGFGRIDLTIDLSRRPARSKAKHAAVEATLFPPQDLAKPGFAFFGSYEGAPLAADPAVEAAVAPAQAAARAKREEKLGLVIARAVVTGYDSESPLGNLVTDLMRAANPKADVALTNGGALRADLPAGALSYGQLHETLPFDDRFATVPITGAALAATIAANLEHGGSIVSLSGVRARAACVDGALQVTLTRPDGRAVGPGERLTLVTSEFLAAGGAEVLTAEVRAGAAPSTGVPVRDAIAGLLRARKTPLDPDHPALYDAAHPRLAYPGTRPVHCK
ncbi:MAG TPA: 5'-nucleotidase C-terminal domain-containing protein [Polyangia bacterium]|jgi:5'-nucleotidase